MKARNRQPEAPRQCGTLVDAGAATRLLSVSRNTLYAYVSRGLVRAMPDPDRPKSSLYVAADIQMLLDRKKRMRKPRTAAATALDFGLPVLKSQITRLENNRLLYRDRDAIEFSRDATLEDAARLIWNTGPVDPFPGADVDTSSVKGWDDLLRLFAGALATDRASALLPLLTHGPGATGAVAGELVHRTAARLLRTMAAAATGQRGKVRGPIHAYVAAGIGKPRASTLIRRALVLLADHELNASTFAVRVVASTGAGLTQCLLGGLAALSGPRHGTASERVRAFLDGATSASDAHRLVATRLDAGDSLPGFGHFAYPDGDPRAAELLGLFKPDPVVVATLEAVRQSSGSHPNIDLALVAMERRCGLPPSTAVTLFTIARTVGWLAHALEQRAAGTLIRPRAEFVAP